MSLDSFLTRAVTQIAVYWGTPSEDGHGGYTFADPVEISCRWEDKQEIIEAQNGEQLLSRSVVFVTQDLDELGYLYLGELADFDSTVDTADPISIDGAYQIKRFDKLQEHKSTTLFFRRAYLSQYIT